MKKMVFTLAVWFCLISTSFATEMIMFSTNTCSYCRAFLKEVAPTYNETEYAKLLPLRIITMDNKNAPLWFSKAFDERRIDGIQGTPTFIIFSNGNEVARLMGYSGKDNWYSNIKDFINNNKERLEETAGQNPIPYEKEHELDPKTAATKLVREEGSHSNNVPKKSPFVPFAQQKEDKPNIHNEKLEKFPNGVYNSRDIMDHIYDTETEAQIAANWLGCQGTHTHFIKGKKIWMPCTME